MTDDLIFTYNVQNHIIDNLWLLAAVFKSGRFTRHEFTTYIYLIILNTRFVSPDWSLAYAVSPAPQGH